MEEIRGKKNFQNCARVNALGIITPDGSQHLFAFRELISGNWICGGLSRKDHRFQPMPQKQEGFEQGDLFAAMTF
jgi:hypothetical protein